MKEFQSISLFLFVCVIFGSFVHGIEEKEPCTTSADVSILIDAVKSITTTQWSHVKEFTKSILQTIGATNSRPRLYTFSDEITSVIACKNSTNLTALYEQINDLNRHGVSNSELLEALKNVDNDTNSENCSSLSYTKRALIIIASPNSFENGNIKDIQKRLADIHGSGIKVYTVVAGESATNILMKLSSVPVNLYRIHKYEDLHNSGLEASLTRWLCEDEAKGKRVLTNYNQESDQYGMYYKFGYDEILENVLDRLSRDEKVKFDKTVETSDKTHKTSELGMDKNFQKSSESSKTVNEAVHLEKDLLKTEEVASTRAPIKTYNDEIHEEEVVKESENTDEMISPIKQNTGVKDDKKLTASEENHVDGNKIVQVGNKDLTKTNKIESNTMDTSNRKERKVGDDTKEVDQTEAKEKQLQVEEELREFRKRFLVSILEDDVKNKDKPGMVTTASWDMDIFNTATPSQKLHTTKGKNNRKSASKYSKLTSSPLVKGSVDSADEEINGQRDDRERNFGDMSKNQNERESEEMHTRDMNSNGRNSKMTPTLAPTPLKRQSDENSSENEIERKTVIYTPSKTERRDRSRKTNDQKYALSSESEVQKPSLLSSSEQIKTNKKQSKEFDLKYEESKKNEIKSISSKDKQENEARQEIVDSIRRNVSLFLNPKLKKQTEMASDLVQDLNNEFLQLIEVLLESMNLRTKSATTKVLAMMVTLYTRDIDNIVTVLMELGRVKDKQIERLFLELKGRVKTEANEFTSKLYSVIDKAQVSTAPILKDIVKEIILETDVMLKDLLALRESRKKIPYSLVRRIIDDLSRKIRLIQENLLEIKDDFPEKELEAFQESFDDFIKEILNAMDVKDANDKIRRNIIQINKDIMDLIANQLSDEKKDRDVNKLKKELPNRVEGLTKKLNDIARDLPEGKLKDMIQKHIDNVDRSIRNLVSGLGDIDGEDTKESKLRDINRLIEKANENIEDEVEQISGKIKPKSIERKVEKSIKKPVDAMLKRMKLKKGTKKAKHVITLSTMLNDDMKQLIDTISIEVGDGTREKENDIENLKKKIYSEIEDLTRELNDLANDLTNEKDRSVIKHSIKELEEQLAKMVEELLGTGRSSGDKQKSMKDIVNRMQDGARAIEDDLIGKGSTKAITKKIVKKIDKFVDGLKRRTNIMNTARGKHVNKLTSELNGSIRKMMNSLSDKQNRRSLNDIEKDADDVINNIGKLTEELLEAAETISDPDEKDFIVKSTDKLKGDITNAVEKLLKARANGESDESMLEIVDNLKDELDSLNRDLSKNGSSQGRKLANNVVKRINGVMDSLLNRMKVKKGSKKSQHVVTLFTMLNDGVKELVDALTKNYDGNQDPAEERERTTNPIADKVLKRKDEAIKSLLDIADNIDDGKEKRMILKSIKDLDDDIKDMVKDLMETIKDDPEAVNDSINKIMKNMDKKIKSIENELHKNKDAGDDNNNASRLQKKMNNLVEDLLDEINPRNKNADKRRLSNDIKDFNKDLNNLIDVLTSSENNPDDESRDEIIDKMIRATRGVADRITNEILKIADKVGNKNDHELAKRVAEKLNGKLHKMLEKIADSRKTPPRETDRIVKAAIDDAISDVNDISRSTRSKGKGQAEKQFAKALQRTNENVKELVKELLDTTGENRDEQQPKIDRVADELKSNIHDLGDSLVTLAKSSKGSKSRKARNVIDGLNNELEEFARDLSDTISDPSQTSKAKVKRIMGRMQGINKTVKKLRRELSRKPKRRIHDGGRAHSDVRTLPYNANPTATTEYNSFVRIYLSGSYSINTLSQGSLWYLLMTLYSLIYCLYSC